jgi:cytochrome c oxidase accessory protein FixG
VERPPGGAVRPADAQVLHLRPGSGRRTSSICRPADHLGLALFLFTAVAGRLWCGYACPQTVYTEIFMWIERKVEGDRVARMKLDRALELRKLGARRPSTLLWMGAGAVDRLHLRRLLHADPRRSCSDRARNLALGPWETFWILFYGFATYGNAGFMREQVCKYMCPYARFQSAMFDPDTLIITYDEERGEPRGSRRRKADPRRSGWGDCVDCNLCVAGLPDRHRHPQRPAVRVHRLRRLRRRLRLR